MGIWIKSFIFFFILLFSCATVNKKVEKNLYEENSKKNKIISEDYVSKEKINNLDNKKEESKKNQIENESTINNDKIQKMEEVSNNKMQENKKSDNIASNLTSSIDTQNTQQDAKTENFDSTLTKEDINLILFYKKMFKEEELIYKKELENYFQNKIYIKKFKDRSDTEEKEYNSFVKNYTISLDQEKQKRIELLNQIDPERNMFWRVDTDKLFDEVLIIPISKEKYKICEVEDPFSYLFTNKNKCNHSKIIEREYLINRNFNEEVSIFELLPKRKGYYIILNENLDRLKIQDKNHNFYTVSYIESDGENIVKFYLYVIQSNFNQNKIYFKIYTPLNVFFRLFE